MRLGWRVVSRDRGLCTHPQDRDTVGGPGRGEVQARAELEHPDVLPCGRLPTARRHASTPRAHGRAATPTPQPPVSAGWLAPLLPLCAAVTSASHPAQAAVCGWPRRPGSRTHRPVQLRLRRVVGGVEGLAEAVREARVRVDGLLCNAGVRHADVEADLLRARQTAPKPKQESRSEAQSESASSRPVTDALPSQRAGGAFRTVSTEPVGMPCSATVLPMEATFGGGRPGLRYTCTTLAAPPLGAAALALSVAQQYRATPAAAAAAAAAVAPSIRAGASPARWATPAPAVAQR